MMPLVFQIVASINQVEAGIRTQKALHLNLKGQSTETVIPLQGPKKLGSKNTRIALLLLDQKQSKEKSTGTVMVQPREETGR